MELRLIGRADELIQDKDLIVTFTAYAGPKGEDFWGFMATKVLKLNGAGVGKTVAPMAVFETREERNTAAAAFLKGAN